MMDANNLVGEAPAAPLTPATPPASIGGRLAAGLLGLLLLWLVVARFKVAMLGLLGVGVAWGVQRGRGRPYTRTAGWVGAVGVTCVALLITLGVIAAKAPPGSLDAIMQKMAQDQAHRRQQPLPRFLQRMAPTAQPSPAAQAAQQRVLQSRGFVTATLLIGGLIGSSIGGFLFGSLMWAVVTTLLYAAFGRWTFGAPPPPA